MYLRLTCHEIKFFGSTKTASKGESRIFPCLNMITYSKWTLTIGGTALDLSDVLEVVQSLSAGLEMTRVTEMCTIEAYI